MQLRVHLMVQLGVFKVAFKGALGVALELHLFIHLSM